MIRSACHPAVRQRKFAAWLGVFAICLTVFMPLLTQWIGAPLEQQQVCSSSHGAQTMPAGGDSLPLIHGLDHCGYCSLAAHTPFVASGGAALADFAPAPPHVQPAVGAPLLPGVRYLHAQPRAPPAFA